MKPPFKQRIIFFIQLSVGIALILWIMLQVDRHKFIEYFKNISVSNLILMLFLSAISLVIQFQRWWYLVKQYSVSFNEKDLIPSFFAGFSLRLIIPGGPAEFSKIYLMSGKKRGKVLAFGMEKIFITFIKILAILIVLPMTFSLHVFYYILMLALLLPGYFFLPRLPFLRILMEKKVNYHHIFGINVLFSLGILLIMALQYYILLNELHPIAFPATLHTVVYLWASGIVPVSISGLGVREGLAVYFFKFYGIAPAYAVATSLFLFTLNAIVPALIGVFYIYKHRTLFTEIKGSIASTRQIISEVRGKSQTPGENHSDPQKQPGGTGK